MQSVKRSQLRKQRPCPVIAATKLLFHLSFLCIFRVLAPSPLPVEPLDGTASTLTARGLRGGAAVERGHGAEAVETLARGHGGDGLLIHVHEGGGGHVAAQVGLGGADVLAVEGIGAVQARLGRGAGAAGGLVDVLAVDVDSVGDERRAAVAAAGVVLLEAKELELGLDTVEEAAAHVCGGSSSVEDVEWSSRLKWPRVFSSLGKSGRKLRRVVFDKTSSI